MLRPIPYTYASTDGSKPPPPPVDPRGRCIGYGCQARSEDAPELHGSQCPVYRESLPRASWSWVEPVLLGFSALAILALVCYAIFAA